MRGEGGMGAALARLGLWALSLPYGLAVRLRNWAFQHGWKKTFRARVPVVSIGNLTVGGTGKTPLVEYIARFLRGHELRVAILSRGYGAAHGPNDEALVLEQNLPDVPHLQGPDRVELANIAVEELESQVLLLDDGFQHRRLGRDLDIVLIDATNPWGHGYLLPRGLLREPAKGLGRAHLACITRSDLVNERAIESIRARIERLAPGLPVVESVHRPATWLNSKNETLSLEEAKQKPWAAFCGIGNPQAFRQTLERLGQPPLDMRVYPDHHAYTRHDIDKLRDWARTLPPDAHLATTQKDLVKIGLDRLGDRPLWALRIEVELTRNREALESLLGKLVERITNDDGQRNEE